MERNVTKISVSGMERDGTEITVAGMQPSCTEIPVSESEGKGMYYWNPTYGDKRLPVCLDKIWYDRYHIQLIVRTFIRANLLFEFHSM